MLDVMIFVVPATDFFEMVQIPDKRSTRNSQIFDDILPVHYSYPPKVIFANGNKLKKKFLPILTDFSINSTPAIIKYLQTNAILEQIY